MRCQLRVFYDSDRGELRPAHLLRTAQRNEGGEDVWELGFLLFFGVDSSCNLLRSQWCIGVGEQVGDHFHALRQRGRPIELSGFGDGALFWHRHRIARLRRVDGERRLLGHHLNTRQVYGFLTMEEDTKRCEQLIGMEIDAALEQQQHLS